MSFNPNSTDSMFSKIMERLEYQDKILEDIKAQTIKTNGRVTALERERWHQRGIVAALTVAITVGWEYIKWRK